MYGPKGACLAAGLSLRFFFFQAEDGIRDLTVTGVQTCALPICRLCRLDPRLGGALCRRLLRTDGRRRLEIGRASCRERVEIWGGAGLFKNNGLYEGKEDGADNEATEALTVRDELVQRIAARSAA